MSASAPPPASAARRQRALTALGATISLAALAGVVFWALHQESPTLPDSPSQLAALAGAIVVYLAGCGARGERWLKLLEHNGVRPGREDTYGLVAVGYLGNNVLPARAGDALRVYFLAPRARTDARTVIGTIVAERLLDVVLLVGLFVILAYGVLGGVDVPSAGRFLFAALIVAGLLAVLAGTAFVLHRRGHLRRVLAFLAPMGAATLRMRGRHGVALLAWSALVWGCEWGAWWLTAQAAGLDLGLLDVGYLMGLATIFVLVPSGPGYVGTFDAALIFGLHALGHSESALSFLLLLRFVIAVPITLIGLAALAGRFGGIARMRAAVRTS
jgi:glycosyltransferase 2 family protein